MSEESATAAPAKKRGRKKKDETATVVAQEEEASATVEKAAEATFAGRPTKNGLVDWKALIPDEFIEVQTGWLLKNGINPADLNAEQRKELKERAGEENQLIKLGGFKFLAALRGVKKIDYETLGFSADAVTLLCRLEFKDEEEFEGQRLSYSGIATASRENTGYPFNQFLASMAENRSFCRACRSAFNINVLGAEEMDQPSADFTQDALLSDEEGCTSPQESLRILLEKQKGKTFADLKNSLTKKAWEGSEDWHDYKDIPSGECLKIIATIQSKPN